MFEGGRLETISKFRRLPGGVLRRAQDERDRPFVVSAAEFVNLLGANPPALQILYLIFGPEGPKIRYLHKLAGGSSHLL